MRLDAAAPRCGRNVQSSLDGMTAPRLAIEVKSEGRCLVNDIMHLHIRPINSQVHVEITQSFPELSLTLTMSLVSLSIEEGLKLLRSRELDLAKPS